MRNLKIILPLSLICFFFLNACNKEGAPGGTISSQVAGTFMSTAATVRVNNETVLDSAEDLMLTITEVDANTVSVTTEFTNTFEVDLSKSENGDFTTGSTNAAASGFTFSYSVSEGMLIVDYSFDNVTVNFTGMKE